jgi:hypothetical protein
MVRELRRQPPLIAQQNSHAQSIPDIREQQETNMTISRSTPEPIRRGLSLHSTPPIHSLPLFAPLIVNDQTRHFVTNPENLARSSRDSVGACKHGRSRKSLNTSLLDGSLDAAGLNRIGRSPALKGIAQHIAGRDQVRRYRGEWKCIDRPV